MRIRLLMLLLCSVSLAAPAQQAGSGLLAAAAAGRVQQLRSLLAEGVDVNARDGAGRTALINAAAGGNLRTARLLLAAGADADLADARGRTALMEAAAFGHAALVRLLIGLGTDLDAKDKAGRVVTLKLKRADHKLLTRRQSLRDATQMADVIYRTARALFDQTQHNAPYRLLGVGLSDLCSAEAADLSGDLLDPQARARARAERATDEIRKRFGDAAILKGRALR